MTRRWWRQSAEAGAWPQQPPTFTALGAGLLQVPLGEARPEVATGARLQAGQRLATRPQAAGAAIAPCSGTVGNLTQVVLLNGRTSPALQLACDSAGALAEEFAPEQIRQIPAMLAEMKPGNLVQWIDRLVDGGIAADRAASPDLWGQLGQVLRRPVGTVICNLLDSDPTARLNSAVGARFSPSVVAGVAALARVTGATSAWMVIESGLPRRWWKRLRRIGRKLGVQIVDLPNQYPQSDPTLMLYALLNRRLRPGRPPVEQGVLLVDAPAAMAIGRWLLRAEPLLRLPLAIRDHVRGQTHYVIAPVGLPVSDALDQLQIRGPLMLRGGDILRDIRLPSGAVVGSGELVVHLTLPEDAASPEPCIRCAWCVEACPTRLNPAGLLEAAQKYDRALGEEYGLEACIECGICSFVCPSRLPLLEAARRLRRQPLEEEAGP